MYRYEREIGDMVVKQEAVRVDCEHFGKGMVSINEIILVPRVFQKAIRMYDKEKLNDEELKRFFELARIEVVQQLAEEFVHRIKYEYDELNDTYYFRLSIMEDKERQQFEHRIEELNHSIMCSRSQLKHMAQVETCLQRRITYHIGVEENLKRQLKRPHHLLYTHYKRLFRQYKSKILSMFN